MPGPAGPPATSSSLVWLFAGSGCAALIYEVVWYQQLQLVLGSTTVSLSVLLATFMGGLCLGSLVFPRLRVGAWPPLRVFALVEASIAAGGLFVALAIGPAGRAYFAAGDGSAISLRSVLAALVMLPATVAMGASFPAIVRAVERTSGFASRWALLYGSNTAGAVVGCLAAGFFLLRLFNMAVAEGVAIGINLLVAGVSWQLGAAKPEAAGIPKKAGNGRVEWWLYAGIAVSGFCALGAEVVWTRLLGILFLATVYVFAILLAVFLGGLALGGVLVSRLLRKVDARTAFGWCQVLLAAAMLWAAVWITEVLPGWSGTIMLAANPWRTALYHLLFATLAMLPATVLWGASFPLACAAALRSGGEDPAWVAGRLYAANTAGAIAGALLVSLLLVPSVGSQNAERVLLVLAVLAGVGVLLGARSRTWLVAVGALASLGFAAVLPGVSGEVIAYGRNVAEQAGRSDVLWMGEGINSSVAITRWPNGTVYVNVNGHVEATTEAFDMKLQRMVGHLPALLHPGPKSILGIGFGAGVSAGVFTRYPSVEEITVCEIEPLIPPTSDRFFGEQNYHVYRDPRTRVVFDDARHFLMTTQRKFDIIASDPLDVFIKGTAALYTREYFEAVKRRLNPGGYFSLYVPLYETDEATIQSELETFFQVFPEATVWANTREGLGYDLVFLGQSEAFHPDVDQVEARLSGAGYERARESLAGIGMGSAAELLGTYISSAAGLKWWTAGAQLNTDADLRLSYLAGWGVNADLADDHYRKMLRYRTAPRLVFRGSTGALASLGEAIARQAE